MSNTERIEFLKAEHRKISSERNLTEWTLNCEKKELENLEQQLKRINEELEQLMGDKYVSETTDTSGPDLDAP